MKRVVVTGANKGIGLSIVKKLLKENPDVYVYLGSRDSERGLVAIEQIGLEIGPAAKDRVELLEIDVTSGTSVQNAAKSIGKKLDGSIYGLINNAGGGTTTEMSARQIIDLNTNGVRRVSEAFLPLIQNEKGKCKITLIYVL